MPVDFHSNQHSGKTNHRHDHCQKCADSCFKCAEECRKMAV
ncbi:four-helix bundle copper-binding protein [Bacillota bacterium Lsc_1132]